MSWMDSWSRPSKSQATPAPYYAIPGGENTPYCHSCGRLISQRRTNAAAHAKSEARYCSPRCRSHKPGKLDREIEKVFVGFLNGHTALEGQDGVAHGGKKKEKKGHKGRDKVKGDQRILVPCSAVEDLFFKKTEDGSERSRTPVSEVEHEEHEEHAEQHPEQTPRIVTDDGINAPDGLDGVEGLDTDEYSGPSAPKKNDYIDYDVLARMSIRSGTRTRPPQDVSEVNGSVGGEKGWAERIQENEEMLEKRRQGLKRVKEKEMVRCAARRGVVFGFKVDGGGGGGGAEGRMCEAVMNGKVVEPSFAKGDWSIRWRE